MGYNDDGFRDAVINNRYEKAEAVEGSVSLHRKKSQAISSLAEAIILQSIEDMWIETEKADCVDFFTGEGFHTCAELSGMNFPDKVKILALVRNISGKMRRDRQHETLGRRMRE